MRRNPEHSVTKELIALKSPGMNSQVGDHIEWFPNSSNWPLEITKRQENPDGSITFEMRGPGSDGPEGEEIRGQIRIGLGVLGFPFQEIPPSKYRIQEGDNEQDF